MKFKPYTYQRQAIDWVLERERCALFLDMGLGKSVITLSAFEALQRYGEVQTMLVVAPKKVAEATWTREAAKWDHLHHLDVAFIGGTPKRRQRIAMEPHDVYVISRDSFVWLCEIHRGRLPYSMVVLDELTSFKNPSSRRFKAFKAVEPRLPRIVGLTGTPAPNGYVDLWAQIYCIDGGVRLGKAVTRYRDEYFKQITWNNIVIRSIPKPGAQQAITGKIADLALTMKAADYLELPALRVIDEKVALSAKVKALYDDFEREQVLDLPDDAIAATSAAALMNKLSQFCNGAVYDADHAVREVHGEKLERLAELVEAAQSPVLVFYQYRHDIPRILGAMPKGLNAQVYEGAEQLDLWNAGEIDVLLAHPASTAYGLNMQQGGHYIVWFGCGWDLELYEQANARLHRQGQRHSVTVYRLITEGTVEERCVAALDSKSSGQQALLQTLKQLQTKHGKGS